MTLIVIGTAVIAFLFCVGEVYYERDWPRDTGKWFVLSLATLGAWLALGG